MKKSVLFVFAAAIAACQASSQSSSDQQDPPATTASDEQAPPATPSSEDDAGSDATEDVVAKDAGPKTLDECVAACEASHPSGAKLAKQIDKCWADKCSPTCTTDMVSNGTLHLPTSDAGSCAQDVKTPSQACSDCTVANCCAAWDATFGSVDGKTLNACAAACYSKFK